MPLDYRALVQRAAQATDNSRVRDSDSVVGHVLYNLTFGNPIDVFDVEDGVAAPENFRAQDLVKHHKGKPLTEEEAQDYESLSLDLLEDILELIESDVNADWATIYKNLVEIYHAFASGTDINESVELTESFKAGTLTLGDGSKFKLSANEAEMLNDSIKDVSEKTAKKIIANVTKNVKELKSYIAFLDSLNESESVIEELLENFDEETLQMIAEGELSEGEVWDGIRKGAVRGAKVGAATGRAIGAAAGGAYGGIVGGAVGGGHAVAKNAEQYKRKITSVVDRVKKKIASRLVREEEQLDEISKETLKSYIDGAVQDQMSAAMTNRSNALKNTKYFNNAKEVKAFQDKRQRGIEKAEDALDRKEAINKLYKKLGLNKHIKESLQESDGRGGHPANYRNPAAGPVKYNTIKTPVEPGGVAIITNDKKNIDGPLATKVGDIVNVKFSRVEFLRMKVIEMLPDNKIKVQAFNR